MAIINLGGVEFRTPIGQKWTQVPGERNVLIHGKDGTTVPINAAGNVNFSAGDSTTHSVTYTDKYHTDRFKGVDVVFSVKKFTDFQVNCDFIRNIAANRNGVKKEYAGQSGYLIENNPGNYDFVFVKDGCLANINTNNPNVIVWLIPDPKSKGMSYLRIAGGCLFIFIAIIAIGIRSMISVIIFFLIGVSLIVTSISDIKKIKDDQC